MMLLTSLKKCSRKLPLTKPILGLASLFFALHAPQAKAAVIYTYTGNHYTTAGSPYTTSMDVTGSFTFASAIPSNTTYPTAESPLIWSISDGVETITNTSGSPLTLNIGTNSAGSIISWAFGTTFSISTGQLFIASSNVSGSGLNTVCGSDVCDAIYGLGAGHFVGLAGVVNNPGTWTSTLTSTAAPEPTSVFLMIAGLLGMVCVACKRHSVGSVRS